VQVADGDSRFEGIDTTPQPNGYCIDS